VDLAGGGHFDEAGRFRPAQPPPMGTHGDRPDSAHYADQLGAWLHLEPFAFPFSREAVDAAATARLSLLPAAAGD
jgi:hypothetical protein